MDDLEKYLSDVVPSSSRRCATCSCGDEELLEYDARTVRHVRIVWDQSAERWLVDCERCHVTPDHCGWWVWPAEMARRLAAHGEKHARCRP